MAGKKEVTEKPDPLGEWKASDDRKDNVVKVQSLLTKAYKKEETIKKISELLENSDFYDSPASSTHHYNFFGGLVKHSIHVVEILEKMAEEFPCFKVSQVSAIRAGLFHDICKCKTYTVNLNKNGTISKKAFKVDDQYPIGVHGDKSVYILEENRVPLTLEEKLMIRHHMGKFDSMSPNFDTIRRKYPQIGLMSIADQIATQIEDLVSTTDPDEED